jgi:hypothetical protein
MTRIERFLHEPAVAPRCTEDRRGRQPAARRPLSRPEGRRSGTVNRGATHSAEQRGPPGTQRRSKAAGFFRGSQL